MASAFIDKTLQRKELELKHVVSSYYAMGLRHLRTFLLCARKWHNHMLSESDDNTSTRMESILRTLEDALVEDLESGNYIYSSSEDIMEYYTTLLDYSCSLQSDLSMEFIDSVLVNVLDTTGELFQGSLRYISVALKETMVFFKNFILFARLLGFEPWQLQLLYTHLDVVALRVARLCQDCFYEYFSDPYLQLTEELELKFSEMLQKIKPIDPQIHETYVQVLKASNLPGSPHSFTLETNKHVLVKTAI
ncbi:hypothetical protein ACH5RR_009594 [Cinchona calisaya]|uniref:Late blight resistance protein R1A-like N-terminal domain-containing protein n=1 Tax=Cinchona calisaya TaxID=153742 RepID=A0ABD3AHB7_9GENT